MRKLNEKKVVPKSSDVILLTERFFKSEKIDIQKLIDEAQTVERYHPYTKKPNVGGWTSISLRSAGGLTGEMGSNVSGDQKASDPKLFSDTDLMKFTPYIAYLTKCVAGDDNGGLLKVRLMMLEAHKVIGEHIDMFDGDHAKKVKRFHIPIITNPKISFFVNRKRYHLEAGNLYHIDVSQLHSVENNSDMNRIHLVFDVLLTDRIADIISSIVA